MNEFDTSRKLRGSSTKIVWAVAGLAMWIAAGTQAQAPVKKVTYESFHMLQTRNIFDPDRSRDWAPPAPGAPRPTPAPYVRSTPPPAPKPVEYVQLTGVMTTEDETYAFFAGSQPEYNKVVAVSGSIAGATITTITPSGIVVTRDGKQIGVPVGMTVPLDDTQQPGAAALRRGRPLLLTRPALRRLPHPARQPRIRRP